MNQIARNVIRSSVAVPAPRLGFGVSSMATTGTPASILIVEDNDPDVFLVEEALRSQGLPAKLQRSHDGEDAIRVLSNIGDTGLPDLIIIDLNLPKVAGIDVLKHARSLPLLDGVPVLILTSSQSKADRTLALQLGANAYIAKPPTLPEFLSAVGSGILRLLELPQAAPGARHHVVFHGQKRLRRAHEFRPRHTEPILRLRRASQSFQ